MRDSGDSWNDVPISIDGDSVGLANCPAPVIGDSTSAPVCFFNKFSKLLILFKSSEFKFSPGFDGGSSRDAL